MSEESRHLLVLMPHTGECWSCAPTVAKHVQRGGRATMVAICGAAWKDNPDYWTEHMDNCARAADILGCDFEFAGFPGSGSWEPDWAATVKIAELLRRLRPDIVVTMPAESMHEQPHRDHSNSHQVVYYARDAAARVLPGIDGEPFFVNDLYFLGDGSPGDIFIDVSGVEDIVRRSHEAMAYLHMREQSHGALPPPGGSLKRSPNYQTRAGPDRQVQAFRSCYCRERTLDAFPE
jgi:LmbE family N-acetylglucosaminyl deacetylase